MRMNVAVAPTPIFTHNGAKAARITPEQQLRRSVMSCMLWENEFYEDGVSIAERISECVSKLPFSTVANIAIDARMKSKLRHVPLLIANEATKYHKGREVGDLIATIIQRPDELGEFLAIYWGDKNPPVRTNPLPIKEGKNRPLAAQVKLGLARAIQKFDEYGLAKYNGGKRAVALRDVVFLSHPRAHNKDVGSLLARLVNKERIPSGIAEQYELRTDQVGLASPETWENRLSRGEDKRAVFEEMINERKLGALAMLRNLRNMIESGVPDDVIRLGLSTMKVERVLPFRFISAARYAPRFEPELEAAMFKAMEGVPKLAGHTNLLIDVSGSMGATVSAKSELSRMDAAFGLAILAREICEHAQVFTFSYGVVEVPPRRGFALRDAMDRSQAHGGTNLGGAVLEMSRRSADRLIVLTDEQSTDSVPQPAGSKSYMINVASYAAGVGYGKWIHIDGWSEATLAFISELERQG